MSPTNGAISAFSPPGFLDDFTPEQRRAWSEWISSEFDAARDGDPQSFDNDAPRGQFFNPLRMPFDSDKTALDITWTGFPRNVQVENPVDRRRWRIADSSRDVQDEYCEWSVTRDPASGKITRVTFTCEGPEYWSFLAGVAPDVVLRLYQEFVNPAVVAGDLFDAAGVYRPRNRWNTSTTDGAMHLVQRANSLRAEIELAAGASIVRKRGSELLSDAQELIACGQYGDPQRHSDPHIGERVNSLTRQKADITLEDPVGLYFHDLTTTNWSSPDGTDPKTFWRYVRGKNGKHVRAIYEVPADKNYVVGDLRINNRPIEFGAQIADFITMKLTGVATRFGQSSVLPMSGCKRPRSVFGELEAVTARTVESTISRRQPVTRYQASSSARFVQTEARIEGASAQLEQSSSNLLADRLLNATLDERNPVELAMNRVCLEVASEWADAAIDETLPDLLQRQQIANRNLVLGVAEPHRLSDRENLVHAFFTVLVGGGLDDLPTAQCIRSKLPPNRKPTADEMRRAFRECQKKP